MLFTACAPKQDAEAYLGWMYESMPLPDSLSYSREWWQANVQKTLDVRQKMNWGIPEREFRHFVLPLRVNNETLDDFRILYADTLCARVQGLGIADAAMEINHWCHEQATYRPSDARTSSPMATMRNGFGRCGEESVLAVAALRAAGIPARQVYTPRWAHTDDNHAWVEVWVDGKWHFMGACEPEPKLDMAWFNAPVSRAMLLHTRVFGDYHGDEDVILRSPGITEINVIRGYIPTRRSNVRVLDTEGKAVEAAVVEFKIYNYAEFYTVASYLSDSDGNAALDTGCGDMLVWAHKGDRFGFAKSSGEHTTLVLDHKIGEEFSVDLDIVPPVEDPIPSLATRQEIAQNTLRLQYEDSLRLSHDHINHAVQDFLASGNEHAKDICNILCPKDLCDISAEMLQDIASNVKSLDSYVLSPRVDVEFLLPHRGEILASGIGERLQNIDDVIAWTRDSIRLVEGRNPMNLRIPVQSVWRSRLSDEKSRNIFFVALCRTLGFPARIDEVSGKTQYRSAGKWVDVNFGETQNTVLAPFGLLDLQYGGGVVATPKYYRHFTLSDLGSGSCRLLEFGSDADDTPLSQFHGVAVDRGYYVLTSGSRMADGSVLARMEFFNLQKDSLKRVPLTLRQSDQRIAVIGSMDAEQLFLRDGESQQQSLLSATGRGYFLLAVMGERDEPSTHARMEMEAAKEVLNAWGRPVVILGGQHPAGLENEITGKDADGKVLRMLTSGCEKTSLTLPVVTVCDSFGRIVYYSQGYNTSLAADLNRVCSQL